MFGQKFAWSWKLGPERMVETFRLDKSRLTFGDVLIEGKSSWDRRNLLEQVKTTLAAVFSEDARFALSIASVFTEDDPNIVCISFLTRRDALDFVQFAEKLKQKDAKVLFRSVRLAMK